MKPRTVFSALKEARYRKDYSRQQIIDSTIRGAHEEAREHSARFKRYRRFVHRCESWLEQYFDRIESLVYADADGTTWKQIAEALDRDKTVRYLENCCAARGNIMEMQDTEIEAQASMIKTLRTENARLRVMLDAAGVAQLEAADGD